MTKWAHRFSAATVAAVTVTTIFPATAMSAVRSSPVSAVSQARETASQARGTAVNLKVTEKVRRALADAYWTQYYGPYLRKHHPGTGRKKVDGPKKVYYGKVRSAGKDVYWAVGSIGVKGDPISYQDGPHVWRRSAHGAWSYRGDTGGCLDKAPKALLKIWHLRSYC
ncbi:hypothetical protein GCM10027187_43660 [Streptosporangium sandarakinum]|uniref:LGFP repeat-containing protein n=1 Tax=Streptosporangium sandarakinum TaxID=1260955 RepID=A0A852V4L3_9ACTN|nr:hypothetical protein [Streptosporangium sandarakinum]NYF43016.1 hypothetical protein [Streptosporangium sandarakinum]